LINALPGNSSVKMAQYATIEEAVFSVSTVMSQKWTVMMLRVLSVSPTDPPIGWLDSDHVICVYYKSMSVPRLYK
jgi:hypothetical protein